MSALPSHRCGSSPCGPSRCRPQQRIAAAGQPQPSQPGWRNLRNADLSFTTVRGASLRGADLRGSRLFGTDLSNANLSGAQLDPKALEQSHWQGAHGISRGLRSHASLHNAGVEAAQANRWQRLNACSPKQSRPNQQNRWAGLPAESCDASGSGGSGSTGSNKSANGQILQPSNITLTSDRRQNYNR